MSIRLNSEELTIQNVVNLLIYLQDLNIKFNLVLYTEDV